MKAKTEIKKQTRDHVNKRDKVTERAGNLYAANHWYFRMPHVKIS